MLGWASVHALPDIRAMYRDLSEYQPEPPHPGEILREDILPCLKLSRTALARHLGISARRLSDVLAERRPVDRSLAQRLGLAFGHGTRYWLGLQIQYDLWHSDFERPPIVAPLPWSKPAKRAGLPRTGTAA